MRKRNEDTVCGLGSNASGRGGGGYVVIFHQKQRYARYAMRHAPSASHVPLAPGVNLDKRIGTASSKQLGHSGVVLDRANTLVSFAPMSCELLQTRTLS